ncbi:FAD-binding protein [Anaerocolumna sp. MB42-C2]|uniref:FAD-binding protein n=1 Tax=Anaerocolumna sp. MB42-C2 TaxID=3070997 RepID=UPI0027E0E4A2|nr:FAD-binding protein [Anaerocolumna sp. MB42-C2]WMJ86693.1 FAD-binding protein [Anaerocolumna sp. MB42-C2]
MKDTILSIDGIHIPVISLDTAIIGSGCAGFNAADWLYDLERKDIAVLTEGINMGTSRNTGSDKQTYYKLSLASDEADSVRQMASDLFSGGYVNGDNALAEAANSVRCFIKLANLKVPFPTNEYGEYAGYKTDHDPRQRATSAGPLTSKYMTECLERSVRQKGIRILNRYMAIKLLVWNNHIEGLICLNQNAINTSSMGITLVKARHVILATGGPAGCYLNSVYPRSQTGMSGIALEAGVKGANLDQWQYGLASTKFRWNVSGTYQQVLPRYISVDQDGYEREFLPDYFDDPFKALDMEFLKGYEWPFSIENIRTSSKIDMIVYYETVVLGRRVYMDFRNDPTCLKDGFHKLGQEAVTYLSNSLSLLPKPIERLKKMNPLAIDLYLTHGIDLSKEPLEISVCAQHHNGGLAVDSNWETNIKGLYAAGEAAGTFGVRRPGGSALNSAQVGSMRAAQHIAYTTKADIFNSEGFEITAASETKALINHIKYMVNNTDTAFSIIDKKNEIKKKMSLFAAHVRNREKFMALLKELQEIVDSFYINTKLTDMNKLPELLKTRDIFITQIAILSAMEKAAKTTGSIGSSLVLKNGGETLDRYLPDFTFEPFKPLSSNMILLTQKSGNHYQSEYVPVREIPCPDVWFENVWREYRHRMENLL